MYLWEEKNAAAVVYNLKIILSSNQTPADIDMFESWVSQRKIKPL